jgi:NADPH-dependent curcumin reductase CurA
LKSRPKGQPTSDNFEIAEIEVPKLLRNQVKLENVCFTVDPYMRGRMSDAKSYVPPFEVGRPLDGGVVGKVLESQDPRFSEGDMVASDMGGWREHSIVEGPSLRKVRTESFEPADYLGAAGMPGLTAYAGLFELGRPRPGDTVFVSAASGAVGSLVAQFAKLTGCRVYGAAGSDDKVDYLLGTLKLDGAFNYKTSDSVSDSLRELMPEGIDLYWDNVGGDFLEGALGLMNLRGTIVCCGMISSYNAETPPPGPRNLAVIIKNRLQLKGLLVGDHSHLMPEYMARLAGWKKEGLVSWETTKVSGLEKGVEAFLGLFSGSNKGKMIVELGAS